MQPIFSRKSRVNFVVCVLALSRRTATSRRFIRFLLKASPSFWSCFCRRRHLLCDCSPAAPRRSCLADPKKRRKVSSNPFHFLFFEKNLSIHVSVFSSRAGTKCCAIGRALRSGSRLVLLEVNASRLTLIHFIQNFSMGLLMPTFVPVSWKLLQSSTRYGRHPKDFPTSPQEIPSVDKSYAPT